MILRAWLLSDRGHARRLGGYLDDGPTSLAVWQRKRDLTSATASEFVRSVLVAHQSVSCHAVLVHIAISPELELSGAQVERVIDLASEIHGLTELPQHVVEHEKERDHSGREDGGGLARRHFHLLSSAFHPGTGRAIRTGRNYLTNELVARVAEVELGHPIRLGRHALANWQRLREQEETGAAVSYDAGAVASAIARTAARQLQVAGYAVSENDASLMRLWHQELRPRAAHTEGERRAERRTGIPARLVDGLVAEAAAASLGGATDLRGVRFRDALAARDLALCVGDKGNLMVAVWEGEGRDVARCLRAARKARGLPALRRRDAASEVQALELGLDRSGLAAAGSLRAAGRTDEQRGYADRQAALRLRIRDHQRAIEAAEAGGDYGRAEVLGEAQRAAREALAAHVWNGRPRLTAAVPAPVQSLEPVEQEGRRLYQSEPEGVVVWAQGQEADLRLALRHAAARYAGQEIILDARAGGRDFLARATRVAAEEGISLTNPHEPRLPGSRLSQTVVEGDARQQAPDSAALTIGQTPSPPVDGSDLGREAPIPSVGLRPASPLVGAPVPNAAPSEGPVAQALAALITDAAELRAASVRLWQSSPRFVERLQRQAGERGIGLEAMCAVAGNAYAQARGTDVALGDAAGALEEALATLRQRAISFGEVVARCGGLTQTQGSELACARQETLAHLAWVPAAEEPDRPYWAVSALLDPANYAMAPRTPDEMVALRTRAQELDASLPLEGQSYRPRRHRAEGRDGSKPATASHQDGKRAATGRRASTMPIAPEIG